MLVVEERAMAVETLGLGFRLRRFRRLVRGLGVGGLHEARAGNCARSYGADYKCATTFVVFRHDLLPYPLSTDRTGFAGIAIQPVGRPTAAMRRA